ncbi:hypothetical protein BaRGS_00019562, partial [Batillaria attramentaria]
MDFSVVRRSTPRARQEPTYRHLKDAATVLPVQMVYACRGPHLKIQSPQLLFQTPHLPIQRVVSPKVLTNTAIIRRRWLAMIHAAVALSVMLPSDALPLCLPILRVTQRLPILRVVSPKVLTNTAIIWRRRLAMIHAAVALSVMLPSDAFLPPRLPIPRIHPRTQLQLPPR